MAPQKRVHFAEDLERTPSPSYSNSPPPSPALVTPPTIAADMFSPRTQTSPYLTASPVSRRTHARTPSPLSLPAAMLVIPHPVLSTSAHPEPYSGLPSFVWDAANPPDRIAHPTFTTPLTFTPAVLPEPATKPGLHEIVLRCRQGFPWKIVVKPAKPSYENPFPNPDVTVHDVLTQIYFNLRQPVSRHEYHQTPEPLQRGVAQAYYARCDKAANPEREGMKGVKRVDFLMGKTTFRGIEPGSKQGEFFIKFA